jgi:lysozyme
MNELKEQIKFEEGLRLNKYLCTKGHNTIGYGRNVDANPYFPNSKILIPDRITNKQADDILAFDIQETSNHLNSSWPELSNLSPVRRDACIQMAFQLGVDGFMKFKHMRQAIADRFWLLANVEALDSDWFKQTPERAKRVAGQFIINEYYKVPVVNT